MIFKKTLKLFCAVLITSILICSCVNCFVSASPVTNQLYLVSYKQSYDNWCWVACSTSALMHYNIAVSQNSFAAYVTGINPAPDVTATFSEMLGGLQHYGVTGTRTTSSISFSTVRSNINNGKPIISGFAPTWSTPFHMVIINGFDGTSNSDGYINYMDPLTGKFVTLNYLDYRDGDGDYGEWIETLYSIRRS